MSKRRPLEKRRTYNEALSSRTARSGGIARQRQPCAAIVKRSFISGQEMPPPDLMAGKMSKFFLAMARKAL
jgi:hypothetical protein